MSEKRRQTSDSHKEALKTFNAQQHDWYARCRHCDEELSGSLKDLAAHTCEVPHGER